MLRERYGERYRWLLLLSVMVGTMASIMSSTIVNVAIPDMSHYFTLGQHQAKVTGQPAPDTASQQEQHGTHIGGAVAIA